MTETTDLPHGVVIRGTMKPGYEKVLTSEAVAFAVELERKFGAERRRLLDRRAELQERLDAGWKPDFLSETSAIREADWRVAPLPRDIQDRRIEITGPTDRKMVINALNCGANVFMADFEDANTPTWDNLIEGQMNLSDAVRRTITFDDPETGRHYSLNDKTAILFVRPRGWHLPEKHVLVDGEPMSGALFDFALFFFHNAKELVARDSGPYFYVPKIESHLEARLWNDVFLHAQAKLGLPKGTIRATVLIETIMSAFEMDEILYELRDHSAGLNCGRWDYIYSFIKKFAEDPSCVIPDRGQVTMTAHFLRSYSLLLIKTCHPARSMRWAAWQLRSRSEMIRRPTKLRWRRSAPTRSAKPATVTMVPGLRIPGLSRSPKTSSTATCRSRTRSPASARTYTSPHRIFSRSPRAPLPKPG